MSKSRSVSLDESLEAIADSQVANFGKKRKPDASDSQGFDLPPTDFGKSADREYEKPAGRDPNAAGPGRLNPNGCSSGHGHNQDETL